MPDPFFPAPFLAYDAAHRARPVRLVASLRAGDALDLRCVKDAGRALALLQLAPELHHATHNVGTGHTTTNAAAITTAFTVDLPSAGPRPQTGLDTTRRRAHTGFQPRYDTRAAAEDYTSWLHAATRARAGPDEGCAR